MPWILDGISEELSEYLKNNEIAEIVMREINKRFAPFEKVKIKYIDDIKDKAFDEGMIRQIMRAPNKLRLDKIIPNLDQIFRPLMNPQILSIMSTALSAATLVATVAGMAIICDKLNNIDKKLDEIQREITEIHKEIAEMKDFHFEMQIAKPCRKLVDDYKILTPELNKGKPVPEGKVLDLIRECKDYIISLYTLRYKLPLDAVLNPIFTLLPILANCLMVYYQRFWDPTQEKHPLHDSCMSVFDMLSAPEFMNQIQNYMFIQKRQTNRQVNEYLDCHRLIVYSYRSQIEQLLEDLKTCGSIETYEDVMKWSRQFAAQQAKSVQAELEQKYGYEKADAIMAEAGLA